MLVAPTNGLAGVMMQPGVPAPAAVVGKRARAAEAATQGEAGTGLRDLRTAAQPLVSRGASTAAANRAKGTQRGAEQGGQTLEQKKTTSTSKADSAAARNPLSVNELASAAASGTQATGQAKVSFAQVMDRMSRIGAANASAAPASQATGQAIARMPEVPGTQVAVQSGRQTSSLKAKTAQAIEGQVVTAEDGGKSAAVSLTSKRPAAQKDTAKASAAESARQEKPQTASQSAAAVAKAPAQAAAGAEVLAQSLRTGRAQETVEAKVTDKGDGGEVPSDGKLANRRAAAGASSAKGAKSHASGSRADGPGRFMGPDVVVKVQGTGTSGDGQALAMAADGGTRFVPATGEVSAAGAGGYAAAARQAADVPVADQIVESIRASGAALDRQIVVRLSPPELGEVRIVLRTSGERVRGVLTADNPETLRRLERETAVLVQRLEEAGVQVRRLDVVMSRPQDGPASDGPLARDGGRGEPGDGGGGAPTPASVVAAAFGQSAGVGEPAGAGIAGPGLVNVRV